MNTAQKILQLHNAYEKIDSAVLSIKILEYLKEKGFEGYAERTEFLQSITGLSKQTIFAWFNKGRNVKIPFVKLCKIALALNMEVEEILKGEKYMYEKKYLVTLVEGNNEKVLKAFAADEREQANAYGREEAVKKPDNSVVACYGAYVDKDYHIRAGRREIVEIWD